MGGTSVSEPRTLWDRPMIKTLVGPILALIVGFSVPTYVFYWLERSPKLEYELHVSEPFLVEENQNLCLITVNVFNVGEREARELRFDLSLLDAEIRKVSASGSLPSDMLEITSGKTSCSLISAYFNPDDRLSIQALIETGISPIRSPQVSLRCAGANGQLRKRDSSIVRKLKTMGIACVASVVFSTIAMAGLWALIEKRVAKGTALWTSGFWILVAGAFVTANGCGWLLVYIRNHLASY